MTRWVSKQIFHSFLVKIGQDYLQVQFAIRTAQRPHLPKIAASCRVNFGFVLISLSLGFARRAWRCFARR